MYRKIIKTVIILFYLTNQVYGQKTNELQKIEIYFINPKVIRTYARIKLSTFKSNFAKRKEYEEYEGYEENNRNRRDEKDRITITNKNKMNRIAQKIQLLEKCEKPIDAKAVDVRVLVELIYTNGDTISLALQHIESQLIYSDGYYFKLNKKVYRSILKQLPFKYYFGVGCRKVRKSNYSCG